MGLNVTHEGKHSSTFIGRFLQLHDDHLNLVETLGAPGSISAQFKNLTAI